MEILTLHSVFLYISLYFLNIGTDETVIFGKDILLAFYLFIYLIYLFIYIIYLFILFIYLFYYLFIYIDLFI